MNAIVYKNNLKRIDIVQNNTLCLGTMKCSSIKFIQTETENPLLTRRRHNLKTKYILKLAYLPNSIIHKLNIEDIDSYTKVICKSLMPSLIVTQIFREVCTTLRDADIIQNGHEKFQQKNANLPATPWRSFVLYVISYISCVLYNLI